MIFNSLQELQTHCKDFQNNDLVDVSEGLLLAMKNDDGDFVSATITRETSNYDRISEFVVYTSYNMYVYNPNFPIVLGMDIYDKNPWTRVSRNVFG